MVNGEAVNCERVWREISNYVDGEVEPALRSAMEEHFRTCKRCASVLEGTRNVVRLYGDERMLEVPAGFSRRLESRLEKRLAREDRGRWSTWSAWLVPVAALALVTAGVRLANSLTASPPLKSEHAQPGHDVPPNMVVVVSTGANLFHTPGCGFIHNKEKERTLTATEAMREGYVPCLRCMRKYMDVAGLPGAGADDGLEDEEVQVAGH